jgi:putative SOS response-associated peptidase YedK
MPVILATPTEVETWMTAPSKEGLKLQRPLQDGALKIVARGVNRWGRTIGNLSMTGTSYYRLDRPGNVKPAVTERHAA